MYGSACLEVEFWLQMEVELIHIDQLLKSPEITLTLAALKYAKRYHATTSFMADTGIK
jgi:dynein heavy chain 1